MERPARARDTPLPRPSGTDRFGSHPGGVRTLPWYAILTTPVGDLPTGEAWSLVVSGARGHAIGERALGSGRLSQDERRDDREEGTGYGCFRATLGRAQEGCGLDAGGLGQAEQDLRGLHFRRG